ncbi:MAG: bacillithiol biosynthesis cysteine-adding enzyme BshC [Flavobacteriaceae bacterium]|nr:bacillithiol biosynthesis cysteine-adding enzyme BshC [Flavobacteriaceae bacterium]
MKKVRLDHELLGHLPDLAIRVLQSDPALKGFYRPFSKDPESSFLEEKKQHFTTEKRETLLRVMREQYDGFHNPPIGINELTDENCFTITTGHQLNLFTGPLFSWYKIIDIIKIAQSWNKNNDVYSFVPVFWMASEDHDFAEINHFYSNGQQVHWSSDKKGAVGRMPTHGLDKVLQAWSTHLGKTPEADQLKKWFKEAYLGHESLADATRYLLHQLFGKYGLIVLDADHPELKKMFLPVMMEEIKSQSLHENAVKTHKALQKALKKSFVPQVTPRPVNLFYLQTNSRERIDLNNDHYFLVDSDQKFTEKEITHLVGNQPQCFSPNALMRPLYQETILPNVAYVGGGSELAYWLQLKDSFDAFGLMMPMLKLRSSLLLKSQKQDKKLHRLGLTDQNLFMDPNSLINLRVRQISNIDIDLSYLKIHLEEQFKNLYDLTQQTDASFIGAVAAQEKKQKKGIDRLEQRLLKAQRRKLVDQIQRVTDLQRELFPMGELQERFCNFSDFYLIYGDALLPMLMESIDPFDKSFLSLTLEC